MGKNIIKLTYLNKTIVSGKIVDNIKIHFCNVISVFNSDTI